jgi:CubicO group peptidase (beta-lactamase class C family)
MEKKYSWAIVGIISISLVTVLAITIPMLMTPLPSSRSYLPTSTPEEQGMDSSEFEEMYDYIETQSINLHSVLIARNGYIVEESFLENSTRREENYFAPSRWVDPEDNNLHYVWSSSKSIISLLIGITIEMGYIDNINQTLYEFFENVWNPSFPNSTLKQDITIGQLLTQSSGIPYGVWDANQSVILRDLNETLLDVPGNSYKYGNAGVRLLSGIITNVTGQSAADFAQDHLFGPIGIYRDDWYCREDIEGISDGAAGFRFTPRAMARIGLLCLNNGSWNGVQVVPKEWILESITPSSTNSNYGYLWWLTSLPLYYLAGGMNGQCIYMIPEYNIVVIFTADIDEAVYPATYNGLILAFIIGAII